MKNNKKASEEEKKEFGVLLITDMGKILYQVDNSEFKKLPWYKRFWGFIYGPYKESKMKVRPFKASK